MCLEEFKRMLQISKKIWIDILLLLSNLVLIIRSHTFNVQGLCIMCQNTGLKGNFYLFHTHTWCKRLCGLHKLSILGGVSSTDDWLWNPLFTVTLGMTESTRAIPSWKILLARRTSISTIMVVLTKRYPSWIDACKIYCDSNQTNVPIPIIFINHVTDIVTHVCYNSHHATNTLEEEWIDALLKPIPIHTLGLSANASTQMEQVMPCPSRGLTSQGRPSPQVSCHILRLESDSYFRWVFR